MTIDGKGRTIRELLAGRKYSIDYYQREYKWQKKQVADLIDDLASKFLDSHVEATSVAPSPTMAITSLVRSLSATRMGRSISLMVSSVLPR